MTDLEKLDNAATQGIWGQFSSLEGPFKDLAKESIVQKRSNLYRHDSSHHMSAVRDGRQYRLSEWRHANDAAFAEALVNAYRAGRLVEAATAHPHSPMSPDNPSNSRELNREEE